MFTYPGATAIFFVGAINVFFRTLFGMLVELGHEEETYEANGTVYKEV